ncbi:MAG: hypothetical protein ISS78_10840 [Phycisphaerae bacterium]|nr:hypothetical protein [Phycisphaerae bacterium]
MRTTMLVMLALLLACPVVILAGGDQNQNQKGIDGRPDNGEQVKERERPDGPLGPDCPADCPGCPDCDGPNGPGDGTCKESALAQGSAIELADRNRDRDGDCDGDGPNGDGSCDGTGPKDGTGVGPCTCEQPVDEDSDGICDACEGCIPIGDGPNGPKGPRRRGRGNRNSLMLMGGGVCDGTGPKGPGPCTCDEPVDGDGDGFCDDCGGCIPIGDGPKGPKGPKGPGRR